jgi:hypothetical protein
MPCQVENKTEHGTLTECSNLELAVDLTSRSSIRLSFCSSSHPSFNSAGSVGSSGGGASCAEAFSTAARRSALDGVLVGRLLLPPLLDRPLPLRVTLLPENERLSSLPFEGRSGAELEEGALVSSKKASISALVIAGL